MKNPKLMLLRSGRRYRVVAVGCAYQGPYKGLIILPGQPRAGWQLAQAERWAENWDESKLLDYVGNKVGSYVYPHRRSSLYELGFKAEGGNPRQRPVAERDPRAPIYKEANPSVVAPVVAPNVVAPNVVAEPTSIPVDMPSSASTFGIDPFERAAELIQRRRIALREIAEIDAQLQPLLGEGPTLAVKEGMRKPLPSVRN